MDPRKDAVLDANAGMTGDANYGKTRQITIIEQRIFKRISEAWQKEVDPVARRANLMVSGFPLAESQDRVLQIGSCRIRIKGETKPCETMNKAYAGLRDALAPDWGGGAHGEVIEGGTITVGDAVMWVGSEPPSSKDGE
jgi:MOSC domain-containing protein YiiM